MTNPSAKEIYLIFYEYHIPSIKDNEHLLRDNFTAKYEFKDQKRPPDFAAELKNINFKKSFIPFIMDYWASEPSVTDIIGDKQLYVSFERCLRYKVDDTSSLAR
ncbi:unnamed protein product [Parnassius apollo]|uniref:(apollo) hypothetical protein n=1 Tax=Parnassius apollo TaxID=110799 RepID=A0A8S3XPW9_PARAO|nr:unnamed protein product [Parnassius apollo]